MTRVAIIGGGVAGLTAAAHLAPDYDVTVFEAEEHIGYHASGRSAAMFEENYGNEAVRALNRASRAYLEDSDVLSPRGFLMVALPDQAELFEADRLEMGLNNVSVDDARARVPILSQDVTHAATHDGAMDIDTDRLLQVYASQVTSNGGRIQRKTPVIQAEQRPDGWYLQTQQRAEQFDVVVNAAGAWADEFARNSGVEPIGLQPFRRSMARMPAPGGHDVSRWPMLFGPGESWYAKPDAGGWIVSPAEEDSSPPMDAWADDLVIAEGIDRYQAHVIEPVTKVETTWAGLRTFAPDRSLVIGPDPNTDGYFWCAGQGGYGFQTSPAAGRLLADLIAGRKPGLSTEFVDALAPSRF
ncbi:MAG: FAD-dependent oxidoreductase [Boseongicola sp.]|nr:FAD-dependent oxidoreductase [Boseongicola sp.]MDD9979636.1 FAD-dependent oxidoreductase [Boseongicola sp.]